ncbi:hypothetical protein GCM10009129_14170 [Psychrobacter aestuarii]|uniref:DOMON-like domain-containing protein n=1 Tax=Psychrobacter aestuarii TaxID=556327 RepID=A0ABN0VUR5_9GAMM
MVTVTLDKQPQPTLFFDYQISIADKALAKQLAWTPWQTQRVGFTDYLWQETCLECFIAPSTDSRYLEINAHPDGRYALYQFEHYRHPSTLPPPALIDPIQQTKAQIDWQPDTALDGTLTKAGYSYQRRFSLPLAVLFGADHAAHPARLHPCVILRFADSYLYFAPKHPMPPDFHDRQYWTAL